MNQSPLQPRVRSLELAGANPAGPAKPGATDDVNEIMRALANQCAGRFQELPLSCSASPPAAATAGREAELADKLRIANDELKYPLDEADKRARKLRALEREVEVLRPFAPPKVPTSDAAGSDTARADSDAFV